MTTIPNDTGVVLRTPDGRIVARLCPDPNCGGLLQSDVLYGRAIWSCDGLTHDAENGPLRACERTLERHVGGDR